MLAFTDPCQNIAVGGADASLALTNHAVNVSVEGSGNTVLLLDRTGT